MLLPCCPWHQIAELLPCCYYNYLQQVNKLIFMHHQILWSNREHKGLKFNATN
jgi:hypothetical protein